jgi:epoxyqueuosine reductase QueG
VTPEDVRQSIEKIARTGGAALFGVAGLDGVEDTTGEVALDGLTTGISFGYRLSDIVLEGIVDHPTRTYQYHYRQVNILLDQIGLRVAGYLQEAGHRVFPVPSSQVVDWDAFRGHISHKMVAGLAGLGWIGRNNLLVNPDHGSRVRYASVLTDLALPCDGPIESDCGTCRRCLRACPGGAIGESVSEFDLTKCIETMDRLRKPANIGTRICGLCVKVCKGCL